MGRSPVVRDIPKKRAGLDTPRANYFPIFESLVLFGSMDTREK
jgi:hypothetical protein